MSKAPPKKTLIRHQKACEAREPGYMDPDSGLFVMTSYHLKQRGNCCGSGCRHCPYTAAEQAAAGRPDVPAYPVESVG